MAECPTEIVKCPKEVDIERIIKEIMKDEGLDPEEVQEEEPFDVDNFIKTIKSGNRDEWSRRYFRGNAYGQYQCDNDLCGNSWSSAFAWCVLDLKKQTLEMKFKQECSSGKSHKDMEQLALKDKTSSNVKHMVQWAVDLHLQLAGRKEKRPKSHTNYRSTPEHMNGSCEMCKRLGRLCFERK